MNELMFYLSIMTMVLTLPAVVCMLSRRPGSFISDYIEAGKAILIIVSAFGVICWIVICFWYLVDLI